MKRSPRKVTGVATRKYWAQGWGGQELAVSHGSTERVGLPASGGGICPLLSWQVFLALKALIRTSVLGLFLPFHET